MRFKMTQERVMNRKKLRLLFLLVFVFLPASLIARDASAGGVSGPQLTQFKKAAAQGNAQAQYDLGYAYYFGWGVPKNDATADYWLKKAAAQGNARAQNALAHGF